MSDLNPYAPPAADVDSLRPEVAHGFWREGDAVVVPREAGAVLPDRCVRCNDPAGGYKLKRTVYWHHPALYVLVVISALIYVIVAVIVRKRVKLEVGLCERHRSRRRLGFVLLWGGLLGWIPLIALADALGDATVPLIFALILGGIVSGAVLLRVVHAKRIDADYAWLKVGEPFLASIASEQTVRHARV